MTQQVDTEWVNGDAIVVGDHLIEDGITYEVVALRDSPSETFPGSTLKLRPRATREYMVLHERRYERVIAR